jgi:hypothetical protein
MLDSNSKAARLLVLLFVIASSACGTDGDKSNPVPVKDAGADATIDAAADGPSAAKADADLPIDAGVDSADAASE